MKLLAWKEDISPQQHVFEFMMSPEGIKLDY